VTCTYTHSPTPSITPTLVPGDVVQLTVYNSAGEVVRHLPPVSLYSPPQSLGSASSVFVPDQGQSGVAFFPGTQRTVSWNGANDNGQVVGGGVYTLSASYTDSFGKTVTYSVPMQVLRAPTLVTVQVFNAAGELVRTLSVPATGLQPGAPQLSASSLVPPPASAGASAGLRIGLGGAQAGWWDGRDAQGGVVASGDYMVKVSWQVNGQMAETFAETVTVLGMAAGDPLATAWMGPDPVHAGQWPLVIGLAPSIDARQLRARVYDVAGELVSVLAPDAAGRLAWQGQGGAAGGVYLVELSIPDSEGRLRRRLMKVAVLR
jgi:hypothetical protein